MYKEMKFDSLALLVDDYKRSYEAWSHRIVKIKIGLVVSTILKIVYPRKGFYTQTLEPEQQVLHDIYSLEEVCWQFLTLSEIGESEWKHVLEILEYFGNECVRLSKRRTLEDSFKVHLRANSLAVLFST